MSHDNSIINEAVILQIIYKSHTHKLFFTLLLIWINFKLNMDKLEQQEGLHSQDTLCRQMITNTIESYWIPSQKKTNQS